MLDPTTSGIRLPLAARSTYQPLLIVLATVCAGIIFDRYVALAFWVWIAVAAVALGLWVWLWQRGSGTGAVMALLLAASAIGGAWHHACWFFFAADDLGRFA